MASELPKVKLYWLEKSRSQRIVWLLEELGFPYEIEVFHRDKQTMLAPPELQKIHPLGKSPVISVTPAAGGEPVVIAESGFMTEYLCQHAPEEKQHLVPKRWKEGQENKVGGETEAWMRHQYFMHYAEGTLMPILVMGLVIGRLKGSDIPFFVRPITSMVANRIFNMFLLPNVKRNFKFLEQQLETSGGDYLCGDQLTAADILMSFPLIASKSRLNSFGEWEGGSWEKASPKVAKYIERLENSPGYKKSIEKIEAVDGKFVSTL